MKKLAVIFVLTVFIASLLITSPAMAVSPPSCVSVIIVFKEAVSTQDVGYLTAIGGMVKYTYTIINGVAADLPLASANKLKSLQKNPEAAGSDPLASRISYIEDDMTMHALGNDRRISRAAGGDGTGKRRKTGQCGCVVAARQ